MAKKTKIKGTKESDFITIDAADLENANVNLKSGLDTLAIISADDYVFDADGYQKLKGVDALDFSGIEGDTLIVDLDSSLLKKSDNDELTIVSGDNGIDSLSADSDGKGTYFVAGSGMIQLADGIENIITIADGSSVEVMGGTGDDTITASSDGSILNGGDGNNTLILGTGADTVIVAANSGNTSVIGFDASIDTIDITGLSLTNLDTILTSAVDDGSGNTIVDLGGGNLLIIEGAAPDEVDAGDFSIAGITLAPNTHIIETGTSAADLNALIAAADDGTTFLLTDGTHTFTESITIDRGNISLRGQSEAGTILQFDFEAGAEMDGLMVTGGERSYLGNFSGGVAVGDTSIEFAGHGLSAGDSVYMFQHNTREWLDANGWENVSMEDADHRPFREVILQVDRVEGDVLHFTHGIPYAMDEGEVKITNIEMHEGLNFSDFTITHGMEAADTYDFTNTMPNYDWVNAFSMVGTVGATMERISTLDVGSRGIAIGSTIDLAADDILTQGSQDKGGGGNGYGLLLYESNNNSLTNLEIYDTRHSFITSAWSAETDNYVHITGTNRDINFHGSPDRGNVIEVDTSILDYDVPFDGSGGRGWTVVSGSASNHAGIDPYAENTVTFGHVEGVNRGDKIYANDDGAYMNGKHGYDELIGGDGADMLVGGTMSDTLTGGADSDTFLFRMGDSLDTITDMQFGAGGDTIIIANNADIVSFDDLYFYMRDDEVRMRYGTNSTVVLEGVELADVVAENFEFDPTGALTAELYFGSDYLAV